MIIFFELIRCGKSFNHWNELTQYGTVLSGMLTKSADIAAALALKHKQHLIVSNGERTWWVESVESTRLDELPLIM